ncbi:hypothetical protein F5Y04DRAFT_277740 [Hypomontagnella monticulosa]|nr:hypothetical protein F5Y04DRAFT_277740 [Hypomontagnella monticulosa]
MSNQDKAVPSRTKELERSISPHLEHKDEFRHLSPSSENDLHGLGKMGWLHTVAAEGQYERARFLLMSAWYDIYERDEEERIPLHLAVLNGHKDMAELLLQHGRDFPGDGHDGVDAQDKYKKTPLYYAVEDAQIGIIKLLLLNGAQPDVLCEGCSILSLVFREEGHRKITDEGRYHITRELLRYNSSPAYGVDDGVISLITAAASGDEAKVKTLLRENVDVNSQDILGYNALYEAARFGHHKVVEALFQVRAKPNSRIRLDGNTVLHGVIDRGHMPQLDVRPISQYIDARARVTSLADSHVDVVRMLLQHGAQPDAKRWDGLTPMDLIHKLLNGNPIGNIHDATQNGQNVTLAPREKDIIGKIQCLIGKPPPATRKATPAPDQFSLSPKGLDEEKRELCMRFKVKVQYHGGETFRYHNSSVERFIYNCSEEEREICKELEKWAIDEGVKNNTQWWRWIHLPVNNKLWVKDLIIALYGHVASNIDARTLEDFVDESYQEVRGTAAKARYRKPSFTKDSRKNGSAFSLVIPYIDTDVTSALLPRRQGGSSLKEQLRAAYNRDDGTAHNLHLSLTLDRSYYTSLLDTSDRDKDQVISRYYSAARKSIKEVKDHHHHRYTKFSPQPLLTQEPVKIIWISQLWLWQIDDNTIVTAFPQRWYEDRRLDVLTHTLDRIWASPPSSMNQMIFNIIQQCVGFVDAPANAGLNDNFLAIFEDSLGQLEKVEMTHVEEEQLNNAEDKICDISQEVDDLVEVKDICEEIRMIQRVLTDQNNVISKFWKDRKDNDLVKDIDFDGIATLSLRRGKAKWLSSAGDSLRSSLENLMDLKQKQGNLNEARDTRKLAAEAEKRQLESEEQSQLIFIFTVVTVIYVPIAFTASFFAIPSSDFPAGTNGQAAWRWWQILVGSLVTEVATLLVAGILYYYRQTRKRIMILPQLRYLWFNPQKVVEMVWYRMRYALFRLQDMIESAKLGLIHRLRGGARRVGDGEVGYAENYVSEGEIMAMPSGI